MPSDRKPEFFKGTQLKVAIIGCGYVGLPLGLRFAEAGHKVTGFDTDPKKVEMLQRLYDDPNNSIDTICRTLRLSRTTLYRYVTPSKQAARAAASG